jgi:hypothetical protein
MAYAPGGEPAFFNTAPEGLISATHVLLGNNISLNVHSGARTAIIHFTCRFTNRSPDMYTSSKRRLGCTWPGECVPFLELGPPFMPLAAFVGSGGNVNRTRSSENDLYLVLFISSSGGV